jgi:hypothetical protein
MVVNACITSTQEAEAVGSGIPDQPGLFNKMEASLSYIARPFLKK